MKLIKLVDSKYSNLKRTWATLKKYSWNFFLISFGTGLSKLAGCIRQIFVAAAFGVGVTYDAFNYAYIIPGFLLIIIGGINGPLHNAVVAVLTPLNKTNSGIFLPQFLL